MACFNPKFAIKSKIFRIDEKTGEVLRSNKLRFISATTDEEEVMPNVTAIPCGKCAGCIIDKAKQNANRVALELKFWKKGVFVTLTYDPQHIPNHRSLKKSDLQKFWKRLRKKEKGLKPWYHKDKLQFPIRYISCGEYGEKKGRPHYHAIILNWMPDDLKPYKQNKWKDWTYTSKKLQKIWGLGKVIVGIASYESATYVAQYVGKKIFKKKKLRKRQKPEFTENSRNEGIGSTIFHEENFHEIFRRGTIIISTAKGKRIQKIPDFLNEKYKKMIGFEERCQFFDEKDKRAKEIKIKFIEKLKQLGLTKQQYTLRQKELFLDSYKRYKRDTYDEN